MMTARMVAVGMVSFRVNAKSFGHGLCPCFGFCSLVRQRPAAVRNGSENVRRRSGPVTYNADMKLRRPLVRELVFQAYTRPLHPELFQIRARERVQKLGHDVTVQLTATGHTVIWHADGRFLTEVLTAADILLPTNRLFEYRLQPGSGPIHRDVPPRGEQPGFCYQACFHTEVLDGPEFRRVHDEIEADARKRGMLVRLPQKRTKTCPPLGFIVIEGHPACLLIHAFHTFPDERTVVKSQSLIEFHK
jgi:hypothetical protein